MSEDHGAAASVAASEAASEWLSLKDAAVAAGMSRRTIQSWVEKKWLERRQGVDGWQVSRASLAAVLDIRRGEGTPPERPERAAELAASVASDLAGLPDDGALEVYHAGLGGKISLSILLALATGYQRDMEAARQTQASLHAEVSVLNFRLGAAENELTHARERERALETRLAALADAPAPALPRSRFWRWVRVQLGDPV